MLDMMLVARTYDVKMADLIRMSDLVIHIIFVKMTTDMKVGNVENERDVEKTKRF